MKRKKSKVENATDSVQTEETEKLDGEMKPCKYCHEMVPGRAKICPNCNRKLKRNRLVPFLILLIIVFLAAVGGLYYYFYLYQPFVGVETAVPGGETEQPADMADEQGETVEKPEQAADSQVSDADNVPAAELIDAEDRETREAVVKLLPEADDNQKNQDEAEEKKLETVQTEETENEPGDIVNIEITAAKVTEDDTCGADGPILDYADDSTVIFHDYYGLFVFDLEADRIVSSIDLVPIGCQYTQGDEVCVVSVEEFGEIVYLHPANDDSMYVYDREQHTLGRQVYKPEKADELAELEVTEQCIEEDPTVFRSFSCAKIKKDTYLYLESGSGMAADLCYVIEKKGSRLECGSIFGSYLDGVQEVTVTGEDETVQTQDMTLEKEAADMDEAEESFRTDCELVFYKALLRQQEEYLEKAVKLEAEVVKQIDGGLFDENIYYLCRTEDKDGMERYYIIRDDRDNPFELIFEGDVLMIYGRFFGTGRLPADVSVMRAAAPAISMRYFDLLEE